MIYRYYIAYQFKGGFGRCFIVRDTPLDTEEAITDAHLSLEKEMGFPLVILNWKRVD